MIFVVKLRPDIYNNRRNKLIPNNFKMLKKLLLLTLALVVLTACTNTPPQENILKKVEIETKVTDIQLNGTNLSFDIEITRPDIETPTTEDIPIELQTRIMRVSSPEETEFDYGSMCSRYMSISHRCPDYSGIEIDPTKAGKTEKVLIKMLFEDDVYAEKLLEIPIPKAIPQSKILFPLQTPAQNDKFKISFKDIGADKYDISFRLCHPYQNDGINPCLEGDDYTIIMEKDGIKMTTYSTAKPMKSIAGDVITIESMYPITFEESVNYTIIATKQYTLPDGTNIFLTSENTIYFPDSTI